MPLTILATLRDDENGLALTEFALIAPALCMTLFGLFELSHNIYTATMVEGAIQKAARDATIEGAGVYDGAIDQNVSRAVGRIVPEATLQFTRQSYTDFADVNRPEDYSDLNSDGTCNDNEPFEDANGNGTWDEDRGRAGNGNARDAVLYEVTVTYDRMFPVAAFLGFEPTSRPARQQCCATSPMPSRKMSPRWEIAHDLH